MTTASLGAVARYVRRLSDQDTRALADRQLLDRFTCARDESAFAELVRRHGPMVLAVCRRILGNPHDAEDAFQAAFLVLARRAGSIRQRDSVGGWLYQVAYRIALRARTRGQRRRVAPLSDDVPEPSAESPADALAGPLGEEVERLPEPYRSAVVLCYLEGRTQGEAARVLETTAQAVNSRLKRAREMLRQRLVRRGLALSGAAVAQALASGAAQAALPADLVRLTVGTAFQFAANGASTLAAADLARGALSAMTTPRLKILSALVLVLTLLAVGALFVPSAAQGEDPTPVTPRAQADKPRPTSQGKPAAQPGAKRKPRFSCILLWMEGGPSQFETFDLKPGNPNGGPFKPLGTAVKDIQISEHLPQLAKLTNHLAIIRTLTHKEGDHNRATYLMRTGHAPDLQIDYPSLGAVLAKELGDARPTLPRYFSIAATGFFRRPGDGAGFLGAGYSPLFVGMRAFGGNQPGPDEALRLPAVEEFEARAKGRGKEHHKAVAKAFDLGEEKPAVRDAYGRGLFGQSCLLARRLVEAGVPMVEVTLPGWDTHGNNFEMVKKLSEQLDPAWSALLKDLHERKRLDQTLVVWMGEFGRTPRINVNKGRDHWPISFPVVLAGGGIKGGQVIGKTSADGVKIEEGPVKPVELLATIYRAVGVDPTRENRASNGALVPLVEKAAKPIMEVLR
ncbi:MAG: sigma-70 family RNA polymerase sigma factor [Gemmataceae bacterium]|nr:sigma-70 family RNA polymerase sigma factor [Gemmataceae bacterium]